MQRPVLLTGMMGAGKTSVGRHLAQRLSLDFVDLDGLIEEHTGRRIAELFRDGESSFRQIERDLLLAELDDPRPRIVALGGGALLERPTRLLALDRAVVVHLSASVSTLRSRLSGDTSRPLLRGGPERIQTLLDDRRDAYAESHGRVATDDRTLDQIVDDVLELLRLDPISVAAGERSYPVVVTPAGPALDWVLAKLCPSGTLLVTDSNVGPLIESAMRARLGRSLQGVHVFAAGEQHKHILSMLAGWEAAQRAGLDRRSVIVAVGGGVVTDMGGFLASGWLRGVRWLSLPTTMLGMVDASIGGKTGIDLRDAKNAIGAFHQPSAVIADVSRLSTEPERSFRGGLAELVKTALVGDEPLLSLLENEHARVLARDPSCLQHVIRRSMAVKARIVSRDEREQGDRVFLNLGHTLGHALEAAGNFTTWTHGEAVALGTLAALRVGVSLGVTDAALPKRVEALFHRLGLPVRFFRSELDLALERLSHDKKRTGSTLRFVAIERAGLPRSLDLPVAKLASELRRAADVGGMFASGGS